jgi:hypothetical protein
LLVKTSADSSVMQQAQRTGISSKDAPGNGIALPYLGV